MAKDYFQDIVPPSGPSRARPSARPPEPEMPHEDEAVHVPISRDEDVYAEEPIPHENGDRSIRNVSIQRTTPRRAAEMRDMGNLGPSRRTGSRWWLWILALVAVLIVAALVLVAVRPTSVTIVPRTHTLTFSGEQFTAYPTETEGMLSYTVTTVDLDDSEVVTSEGTVYAEDKASGNITVYNNFQTTPLRLVRNTRFATASGLVYRTPTEIVVPAKQGTTPGKIEVTVVADQAGEEYNVAPGRFTLPGLQSTPDMYAAVYAESTSAFTGGFKGERPGVNAEALESAVATVRTRLEEKARSAVASTDSTIALSELATVEYQNMPNTTEAGGAVRIHQRARVSVPTFTLSDFLSEVARSAISDSDAEGISLINAESLSATPVEVPATLGSDTIDFTLSGSGKLVWEIPEGEIQAALAGKDQGAFESIIATFNSVQEARASVQPFWKDSFPADSSKIKIKVEGPENEE